MRILLVIAIILSAAAAAESQEGLDKIKLKDRVVVQLKNKNTLQGNIAAPPHLMSYDGKKGQWKADEEKARGLELSKQKNLWIDVSLDFPALGKNALLSVPLDQVTAIRILSPLTAEELAKIQAVIERTRDRVKAEEEARKAEVAKRNAETEEAIAAAEEVDLEKVEGMSDEERAAIEAALEVYTRFPPPDWGPERLEAIARKGFHRQPITLDEREFQTKFPEWTKAQQFLEKQKEAVKKATEEKKGEETEAPEGAAPENP